MNFETIIDITPVVSSRLAVFPGDEPFQRHVLLDMLKGDNIGLSWIKTTVHIGAHTDAPSHYHCEGDSIDKRDLSFYVGPCQVIRLEKLKKGERILPHHIENYTIQTPRVLFFTGSYNPEVWTDDFNSLSPELIETLARKGVRLVGIDTPSVDPAQCKTLDSHAALCRFDLAVLEGIVLNHVKEGLYTLVALPLKLEGADASPVRAILLP